MKLKVTIEVQTIDEAVKTLETLREQLRVLKANILVGE